METKTLVVFYSRSGHTRAVAEALARELGADIDEIREETERGGLGGYLRSSLGTLLGWQTKIDRIEHAPRAYDLVVVGGPVWNASLSIPIRTFLREYPLDLPNVGFFVTYGGSGARRVFRQMARLVGKRPIATMAVRERELRRGDVSRLVERFAADLRGRPPSKSVPLTTPTRVGGPVGSPA